MELLKSEDEGDQRVGQSLLVVAPLFLVQLNGNMALEFDDFDDIAEQPMAAPAMATFEQLFEGFMEGDPSSFLEK